ncbi:MAG: insulinase family protein, partial [Prevotella sp.]|nr:insulinase family protein [Prevotella sp.]
MKRILSLLSAALITAALFAQSAVLQVRELTLSNGMTVWLNEDHTQPKVFGVVVVRAGAKDCPDTGIAHYFEHIMFKGTDRIGTVDYEAERPWLDSISAQYDLLSQTNATALPGLSEKEIEARRTTIQHHINALSLRAADYAIPNEFSRLISQYGGSGLNAATGPDVTYYYNEFLPQYIGQWCWLNSERLLKPVFRGFQGELENVYEEKNRSADNFGGALDKVLKTVFKDQPYAYPVLGSTENLKNPRLSDMEAFYRQYYVAPNMCLMLVGDITPDSTLIGLLEQTFGRVQTGPVPTRTVSTLPPFAKGEKAEVKVPIPLISARALVYATPTAFDADAPAMMVARQLLYNEQAGMLDSLVNEHRVMMAGMMGFDQLADAAADALFIVPKIPFGSMKKAEKACLEQLQRLIDGQFTDEQLQMQKRLLLMEAEQGLETIDDRAQHMIDVYARGRSWPQYLQQIEALRNVGRDDVMRVARKYYTADYLTLVKKFGIDRKDVLQQPGYLPVAPRNAGAKSAFAQWLDSLPVGHQPIRTVNLSSDVERIALGSYASLYCKQNPVNDIFTFCLRYYNGTRTTPLVAQLAQYLGTIGTDSLSKQQIEAAWQRMGVNMSVDTGDERTAFTLTGRDNQLEPALGLLAHFLAR